MNAVGQRHAAICFEGACPHWCSRHGDVWRWPRCTEGGKERELDYEFLEGPDSNCPTGRWGKTVLGPDRPPLPPPRHLPHCVFASPAGCCERKRECRLHDEIVRVLDEAECSPACPDACPQLRWTAIVAARNEGAELPKTLDSLIASNVESALTVTVIDDGSTDGTLNTEPTENTENGATLANAKTDGGLNAEPTEHTETPKRRGNDEQQDGGKAVASLPFNPDVRSSVPSVPSVLKLVVVRHETSQGVGRSWNEAAVAALEAGGDAAADAQVLSFHDGHMRFARGGVEILARKAITSGAVICSGSAGLHYGPAGLELLGERVGAGCDLVINPDGWPEAVWRYAEPDDPPDWFPCQVPHGACYVMSAATARRLMEPTGLLWDTVAGRWGYCEEALAMKAFLLGIPILISGTIDTWHLYRESNPLPGAALEKLKNVCATLARYLTPEEYEACFARSMEAALGNEMEPQIRGDAQAAGLIPWPRPVTDLAEAMNEAAARRARHEQPQAQPVPATPPVLTALPIHPKAVPLRLQHASRRPLVSCLTPTYGRATVLARAIACFMLQDYEPRELIIVNAHPTPLKLAWADRRIHIVNNPRLTTSGRQRRRCVELARGGLARAWDDDDLVMPWAISQAVSQIGDRPAWKPARTWVWKPGEPVTLEGNIFDGTVLYRTEFLRRHPYHVGQGDEAMAPYQAVEAEQGAMPADEMGWLSSYVYLWADGLYHVSGRIGSALSAEEQAAEFRAANQDAPADGLIAPADMRPIWAQFLDAARGVLGPDFGRLEGALAAAGAL